MGKWCIHVMSYAPAAEGLGIAMSSDRGGRPGKNRGSLPRSRARRAGGPWRRAAAALL